MKKKILMMVLCVMLAVTAACGGTRTEEGGKTGTDGTAVSKQNTKREEQTRPEDVIKSIQNAEARMTCRVVGSENGSLLLAKQDGEAYDVYRVSTEGIAAVSAAGGTAELPEGALIEIGFDGAIEETYPARFGNIRGIKVFTDKYDGLCTLYRKVLNDLWNVDSGLNEDITELGVDLSKTRLTKAEQAALAYVFAQDHGLFPIMGTWKELAEQGYIDEENLYWEKGCLFTIAENASSGNEKVKFQAEKWRSGLGAYFFNDCTSNKRSDGSWKDYKIGSESIA